MAVSFAQAENIYAHLLDCSMPCDEPWPEDHLKMRFGLGEDGEDFQRSEDLGFPDC